MYVNARSIVNKHKELELYVREENIDIIGISETWLNEAILDSEMHIEGYTFLRKDRQDKDKKRGGGVAIYVKNDLNAIQREELYEVNFPESIFCSISCRGDSTLLGVIYRPPDSSKINDEALFSLINRISQENVILMGDFNYPELKWDKAETISESHPFVECVNNNFLIQLVDEPTRDKNYLDLVLCSDESIVESLFVGEPFETSDHQLIRFKLISNRDETNKIITNLNYFKANYSEMREYIKTRNWDTLIDGSEVEDLWKKLTEELYMLRDKFIPKSKKVKNKAKWVTKRVTRFRRAKTKAWNKYISSGKDQKFFDRYKIKLRKSVRENRKAKENYEQRLASNIKTDCKSFYSYVNSKRRAKDRVGPLKDSAGKVLNNDRETAEVLNDYFSSVFTVEDLSYIPNAKQMFQGDLESEGLNTLVIDENTVGQKLAELNVNKSQGPDGIHPKLLSELQLELKKPLTKLFNLSISRGIVPQDWKEAIVTPLFKKGSKASPENYRPVSLTSVVGKILESIVKDQIVAHLEFFNLIKSSQHGFTKGRSCLTNLLDFMETVTRELDVSKPIDLIYLDFAKAFDKVPYRRLFKKLETHGISGSVLKWIVNWLGNRRQKTSINKECSNWKNVTSGVPQGSVLGPVLFIIYINDLDSELISKVAKFADDTKMCKSISSAKDAEILRNDLIRLDQWSKDWQMQFNLEKCVVIHMGQKNNQYEYMLGNKRLRQSKMEKDLGIIVDSSCKFSEQCNEAIKHANSTLGMIKRSITCKSKNIIVKLYKALVRPKLEFCVQAWRPFLKKDIVNLEKVQHRATKMIQACRGLNYEDRLIRCGLSTLEDRRTRGDMIEVFKMIKGIDKINFKNFFSPAANNRTRGHKYKLAKSRSRLDIRKNFFSQRVVSGWNELPASVIEADSVNSFKNRYDRFINNKTVRM